MRTTVMAALSIVSLAIVLVLNTYFRLSPVPKAEAKAAVGAVQPFQIPAPSYWVPFTAKWKQVSKEGTKLGVYFRAADGSTRLDSGLEDGKIVVKSISNVTTGRHYELWRGKWASYPMQLPSEGFRPGIRILGLSKGLEASTEVIQGYSVYKSTTIGGVVHLQAPDLNFFPLVTEFDGARQEFFDIVVAEQASDLFLPPSDMEVEVRSELKGIVISR